MPARPLTALQRPPYGKLPIVVDLDNTLILTDSLYEQIAAVCADPVRMLQTLPHLLNGRAALKVALARQAAVDAPTWPLRDDLVAWLRDEADKGREIHLCSTVDQAVVSPVVDHLGFFTTGIGLEASIKAEYLVWRFPDGFVYAGNSSEDIPVWKAARGIVLADASSAVERAASDLGKPVEAQFKRSPLTITDWLKALRAHHWSKNALIFVPFILAHAWVKPSAFVTVVMGLLCLLMITSATYLINDIADLSADRRHLSKRDRALASGRLSIRAGLYAAALLLTVGFIGAVLLSSGFAWTLADYVVLTLAYSFGLKRVPLLDTLIIGTLFTSRLLMGIALLNLNYSEWLLTFSMFFFFSLAIAKRHTEIISAGRGMPDSLASRGYRIEDSPLTLVLGVSSSVASLLIMMLFIVQEVERQGLYSHPKSLWAIPIVLSLWVSRIWLLAHRGQLDDDPVSFALRDKVSLVLGAAVAAIFVIAL